MDYRFVYRDKDGYYWAITDYGPHRLGDRQRNARRRRRQILLASAGLALVVGLVVGLVIVIAVGVNHG